MSDREVIYKKNSQSLLQLMEQAGISSLEELSQVSGIAQLQLIRVQRGLLPKMPLEFAIKLSQVLRIPLERLLALFCNGVPVAEAPQTDTKTEALKQEYQRLQKQLEEQQETLTRAFQQSSLQMLESWLLQWPTAAAVAQDNPQLPAVKLLPLMKPITDLLASWQVEAIASVGEMVAYDPQWHQLMEGSAEPGETVKIRYVGYRQGDRLLYRAKVSPI